jgi:hypothetical protein
MHTSSSEDAIYQSEVNRKGVAGDMAKRMSPDMSIEAEKKSLSKKTKIFLLETIA